MRRTKRIADGRAARGGRPDRTVSGMQTQRRIASEIVVSPESLPDSHVPDIKFGDVPLLDYLILVIRPVLRIQYDVDIQLVGFRILLEQSPIGAGFGLVPGPVCPDRTDRGCPGIAAVPDRNLALPAGHRLPGHLVPAGIGSRLRDRGLGHPGTHRIGEIAPRRSAIDAPGSPHGHHRRDPGGHDQPVAGLHLSMSAGGDIRLAAQQIGGETLPVHSDAAVRVERINPKSLEGLNPAPFVRAHRPPRRVAALRLPRNPRPAVPERPGTLGGSEMTRKHQTHQVMPPGIRRKRAKLIPVHGEGEIDRLRKAAEVAPRFGVPAQPAALIVPRNQRIVGKGNGPPEILDVQDELTVAPVTLLSLTASLIIVIGPVQGPGDPADGPVLDEVGSGGGRGGAGRGPARRQNGGEDQPNSRTPQKAHRSDTSVAVRCTTTGPANPPGARNSSGSPSPPPPQTRVSSSSTPPTAYRLATLRS